MEIPIFFYFQFFQRNKIHNTYMSHLYILIIIILITIIINILHKNSNMNINQHTNDQKLLIMQLWTTHLYYTQLTIEAFLTNSLNLSLLKTYLFKNQKDISDELGCIFKLNSEETNNLTNLLNEHTQAIIQILDAVKTHNDSARIKAITRLCTSGHQIGLALDKLKHTPNTFTHHMKIHNSTIIESIIAYHDRNYEDNIKASNKYLRIGIEMVFDIVTF